MIDLEAVVAAVPGVAAVFRPRPTATGLATQLAESVRSRQAPRLPAVAIEGGQASVSIAVAAGFSARVVASEVHDALLAALAVDAEPVTSVRVRVARVG